VDLATECRAQAVECLRSAQNACTLEAQTYWLAMAQLWLNFAQHAEEREAVRAVDPSTIAEERGDGDQTPESSGPSY
jgi:hypothetical protein